MDSHNDAQQRSGSGQWQRDCGEAGPQHGQADCQPCGQGGVVARERPVPCAGALRDEVGPRAQGTTWPLLVHHQLHGFADRIGSDGADAGQHGSGGESWVRVADSGPPHPGQQHPEDHQSALGGYFEERAKPRGSVRHCPGRRSVGGRRGSASDLDCVGLTQSARGKPGHCSRSRAKRPQRGQRPTSTDVLSRFSFHKHERRSGDSQGPGPNDSTRLGRSSGLTSAQTSRQSRNVPRLVPVGAGQGARSNSAHTVLQGAGPWVTPQRSAKAIDEDESASGLVVSGLPFDGQKVTAGVGHLDAESALGGREGEAEVASRYASVQRGVRSQLCNHLSCRLEREPPGAELLGHEQTGEAGTSAGGGELHAELADGDAGLGDFWIHVTQRGRACVA